MLESACAVLCCADPDMKEGKHHDFTYDTFKGSNGLLGNFSAINSEKDVLFYWGNQGYIHNLFFNRYHANNLFDLGVRVDTAFG